MIAYFFPKGFPRYQSLPILGPFMDSYAAWLHEQQYTFRSTKYELRMAAHISKYLQDQGYRRIEDVGKYDFGACYQLFRQKCSREAGSVHVLKRFLLEHGLIQISDTSLPSRSDIYLKTFMDYLQNARGYASCTIHRQGQFAAEFLEWLNIEAEPERLSSLCQQDLENFLKKLRKRMNHISLQKPISSLRNFLRFLETSKIVTPGLADQIDTPRIYRQEKLPCTLPWTIVQTFLNTIDRNTNIGIRD